MTDRETDVYRIGSGWMAACACHWESFHQNRARADSALLKHTNNHPAPKREKSHAKPKPAVSWGDREDTTWIDKL